MSEQEAINEGLSISEFIDQDFIEDNIKKENKNVRRRRNTKKTLER
jgi:hypothetical protein